MIQIRNVPAPIHRTLKARAAREGISLSDYLKRELQRVAELPAMSDWLEASAELRPLSSKLDSVRVIRQLRGSG